MAPELRVQPEALAAFVGCRAAQLPPRCQRGRCTAAVAAAEAHEDTCGPTRGAVPGTFDPLSRSPQSGPFPRALGRATGECHLSREGQSRNSIYNILK
eukprot:scaffold336_cov384-Prasinococcus_capsulatus_cf.AAC.15